MKENNENEEKVGGCYHLDVQRPLVTWTLDIQANLRVFLLFLILILFPCSANASLAVNATPQKDTTTTLNSGLVGYWTFDAKDMKTNVADRSGLGNNGALKFGTLGNISTSSMSVAGKMGQALKFDGVDDVVNLTSSLVNLKTTTGSISFWAKFPSETSSPFTVYSVSHATSQYTFQILLGDGASTLLTDELITIITDNGSQGNRIGFTTTNRKLLFNNQWHHITIVSDGTQYKIYLDGVSQTVTVGNGSNNGQWTNLTSSDNAYIGTRNWNSLGFLAYFKNFLDDVRVYSRALSAQEIKELYNQGAGSKVNATPQTDTTTSLKTGLVGYWTFDSKDMKTNVADRSGLGNNGALKFGTLGNISTSSMSVAGKMGQALKFDGVDDYVDLGTSVRSYISKDSTFTISAWFNAKSLTSATDGPTIIASTIGSSNRTDIQIFSGSLIVATYNGTTYTSKSVSITSTSLNKWNHVIMINNGGVVSGYLNGVAMVSSASPNTSTPDRTLIGVDERAPYGMFKGSIDDVRIYSRALSAQEIKELYNQGAGSKINATPQIDTTTTLKTGLVGYWTFDAKDMKTSVADRSGLGNNGALKFGTSGNVSTSSMSVAGKLGQGLKFDGVDDYVLLDASKAVSKGNSSATLSAWVYLNSVSATSNIYVDLGSGGGFRLGCGITLGALYCGGRAPDAQSYQQWNTNGGLISAKTWYHYVTVIDVPTDSIKFYLNGVLKTNIANGNFTNSAFDATNPNSSKIGFNTGELFNGIMDDLRIYNRALSAQEVRQLYNLGR